MDAVTNCSDFGTPKNKQWKQFPHLFPMKWWDQMPWSLFSECWALSQLFHSPLSPSSRGALINGILSFSFWLTSLCIIGSRFIHLIRTDSNAFLFYSWVIFHAKSWLIRKGSDAWRDWGQEEKGTTEDEMAGWHHRLNGHEFEWTPGVGDGQGGLACCSSWGHKESGTTERLNWTEYSIMYMYHNVLIHSSNDGHLGC